jgi:pre-mRNA-processing factor 8
LKVEIFRKQKMTDPPAMDPIRQQKLLERAQKWKKMNTKKYSDKQKFGFVKPQKEQMPPEHLRF